MRSFAAIPAVVLLLSRSHCVMAVVCGAGKYGDSSGVCHYCAPGTYQSDGQNSHTSCSTVQAGTYACGPQTVNNANCYGATTYSSCVAGTYSAGGTVSACTTCSPGYKCPGTMQSQQQACSAGEYVPTAGYTGTDCIACPAGTFNNVVAATRCCNCCAGTYNDITHQTHCFACSEHTNPQVYYSPVGATSVNQCQAKPIAGVTNNPTCSNTQPATAGQAYCPDEQGTTPNSNPSAINRRTVPTKCYRGLKKCPHYSGTGGFDCVDTKTDPESCGGCVGFDADSTGQDCTAIPDASTVKCLRGTCVIKSCKRGYHKSKDGKGCEALPHALQVARHAKAHGRISHGGDI